MKKQKGFTLIELLVVIAIISILSSILLVAIDPVGQSIKADDAKRLAIINQIQKALELYNLDNGRYPAYTSAHSYTLNRMNPMESDLAPYIKIDFDTLFSPHNNTGGMYYKSPSSDGYQSYGMSFKLLSPENDHLEQNDGGHQPTYYEIGENPRYCEGKYSGADAHWWGGTSRCKGGD